MVRMNNTFMKGMQSTFDKTSSSLQSQLQKNGQGQNKCKGKKDEKKRCYWSQNGPGGKGTGGGQTAQGKNDASAGGRTVQACGFQKKRGKRFNSNN